MCLPFCARASKRANFCREFSQTKFMKTMMLHTIRAVVIIILCSFGESVACVSMLN